MSPRLVSVIIPNFNGLDLLKICLPSLRKQSFKNFEVILVDNGSDDGSVEFIKKNYPEFICLELNKNYGFAKAINRGIKKSKGRYLMLLNNDTEVDKSCIEYLVKAAYDHLEVGFISAKILNFYKRNTVDNAGDYLDCVGHQLSRGLGERDGTKFKVGYYIFLATGSGCLISKEVFDRVGLFDEDFFFYMEDADFFFRAQLAGFKGWFEPKAKIYHKRGATSSKVLPNTGSLVFQNMTEMIIKDFPKTLLLHKLNWLKIAVVHLHTLIFLVFKGEGVEVLKVELYLIANFKKILKKRKAVQALKRVPDSYILNNIFEKRFRVGKLLFL